VERFWETAGLITRWVLAAVACWWFFAFLTGIGSSSDRVQELAGYALGKALLCGAIAAIWFYRARGEKQGKELGLALDSELKAGQPLPEGKTNKTELPQVPPIIEASSPVSSPEAAKAMPVSEAPQIAPPSSWVRPETETKEPSAGRNIFIGVVAVLSIAGLFIIGLGISRQNTEPDRTADSKNPYTQYFENLEKPQGASAPAAAAPCPDGLPAGAEVVQVEDLKNLVGSEGKLRSEKVADRDGYIYWFSFKVANETAASQQDLKFPGYCVTRLEVDLAFRLVDGTTQHVLSRRSLDSAYLSPGWSQQLDDYPVGTSKELGPGELVSWRISKAWGFPLHP
jgi:hypothetical protein